MTISQLIEILQHVPAGNTVMIGYDAGGEFVGRDIDGIRIFIGENGEVDHVRIDPK